jgi:hypothetical protein
MRAGLRFGIAAPAIALALAAAPAPAQNTAAPATNTPAAQPPPTDTVGPRELENFSLNGTVTRPAPTTPAPRPATTAPRTTAPQPGPAPARERASNNPGERPAPAPSVTEPLPPANPLTGLPTPAPEDVPAAQPGFDPASPAAEASPDQSGDFMPWLLALLLLGAGAAAYAWRQRSQPGYAAAGGLTDALTSPAPAAAPSPQPLQRTPPPRPAPPSTGSSGFVSTRLRPWLELEFSPGRCVVEDDKTTIQFDVAVYNSGSAPARDVLIEASMFNAGPSQDDEIGAFFAHPIAKGDRIPTIPPLKRVALKSSVTLPRHQVRQFTVGGRTLFVPLVGFNALYRWSGGDGQTSASYLVGRNNNSDKMAPLRLDLGPRIFRGLGAREHSVRVRK